MATGQIANLFHIVADNARHLKIISIGGFTSLKINIGVLGRSPEFRPLRVCPTGAKFRHGLKIRQFGHILIIDDGDLLNFM